MNKEEIKIKISGSDNLGGTNQVELLVTVKDINEIKDFTDKIESVDNEDWSFEIYGCNEGEIEHIISKYSNIDYTIIHFQK